MLSIVIKKILKNKWISICMLAGSVLTIALLACIPIYTRSVLERMLIKNLEITQQTTNVYSGAYQVAAKIAAGDENPADTFEYYDKRVSDKAEKDFGLPILAQSKTMLTKKLLVYTDPKLEKGLDNIGMSLATMTDLADHITVEAGELYDSSNPDCLEVMMTAAALAESKLIMGKEYTLAEARWLREDGDTGTKIKVVGVFTMKDTSDLYWHDGGVDTFGRAAFCADDAFKKFAIDSEYPSLGEATWYYAFDYHQLTIQSGQELLKTYNDEASWFGANAGTFTVKFPMFAELASYERRETELSRTLIIVEVPILLLLAFYIYMVSGLMIDLESNEIAVLKSRGAGSRHIFQIYLIQGVIFSVLSLIIGPFIGLGVCYMLGGANGFLEFVNRSALPVQLTPEAYLYALLAVGFFLVTMLIPAIKASRQTIVMHKQNVARAHHKPIWQKLFLDVVLLGVALYGLYDYSNKQSLMSAVALQGEGSIIDPLMLIICTLFILGAGLVFLRFFPYLVRLIFFIGKRFWSPAFYLSLTQVGRSGGQEQFLMLFLVFTISVGIFSANSARTLNLNQEEDIKYTDGADIVIRNEWKANLSMSSSGAIKSYIEIPAEDYEELDGVECATKVFKYRGLSANSKSGGYVDNVMLMGIEPDKFAKTAWMRNGALPYHWYNYCNLLTEDSNGVILSSEFARKNKVKVGDYISIGFGAEYNVPPLLVYAFVDYWPSIDPREEVNGEVSPYFAITNIDTIFMDIPTQPYEVWIKKEDGATSNQIYQQIIDKDLNMDTRTDTTEDLVALKNDPMLQGLNGTFTLCFIASLIVCFAGFLIYWIMSIKRRQLQFGIIRAMGLSLPSIIGMLVVEQFLISGTSIAAGIGIGTLASYFFIPLYSLTQSAAELTLPFRVISESSDYLRLYVVLAFILISGFIVLAKLISSIKINQALKLGED